MNDKPNSLEEAHGLIQEAMSGVIQEMIILDENQEHHIVYIHSVSFDQETGGINVDFSTPSDRNHVYPHVVSALKAQIAEIEENLKKKTVWYKIKSFFGLA